MGVDSELEAMWRPLLALRVVVFCVLVTAGGMGMHSFNAIVVSLWASHSPDNWIYIAPLAVAFCEVFAIGFTAADRELTILRHRWLIVYDVLVMLLLLADVVFISLMLAQVAVAVNSPFIFYLPPTSFWLAMDALLFVAAVLYMAILGLVDRASKQHMMRAGIEPIE